MFKLKKPEIFASEIAEFMHSKLMGTDFIVSYPVSLANIRSNAFTFFPDDKILPDNIQLSNVLIFCSNNNTDKIMECSYIISKNPKLDFIRVINEFFLEIETFKISKSAVIHPDAKIGHSVSIGENCVIGAESIIGENTQILNNVIIGGRVEIGKNCLIKDNSTIGSEGYNFEIDEDGMSVHYPNIGKILIENNVWIGSNTTIESAAIYDTIIHENVKIDDLVQVGSGCTIEQNCMITAGTILSSNVFISENTWIAPNVTIKENINIGKNCIVGAGSVVIKNITENTVVAGNPAHFIKNNI